MLLRRAEARSRRSSAVCLSSSTGRLLVPSALPAAPADSEAASASQPAANVTDNLQTRLAPAAEGPAQPAEQVAGVPATPQLSLDAATAARALDCVAGDDSRMAALAAFKPPAAAQADWPAFTEAVRLVRNRAVGWPAEIETDEVLRRLLDMNLARSGSVANFAADGVPV